MAMFHTIKSAGTAASEEMASEYYEVKARGAGSKRLLPRRPRIQPVLLTFSQRNGTSKEIKIQHQTSPVPKQWRKFLSNPSRNKQNRANFFPILYPFLTRINYSHTNKSGMRIQMLERLFFNRSWIFRHCAFVIFWSWRSRYSTSTSCQTCSQHLSENYHSVARHKPWRLLYSSFPECQIWRAVA